MKHEHTPASWYVERPKESNGYCYIKTEINGWGYDVCTIYNHDSDDGKANARLIAAAPELLEALEAVQEYVYAFGESHLTDKVNATLKNAKGKNNMTPISERTVIFKTDNGVEWRAYVAPDDSTVCFYGEGVVFEPPADYSVIHLCYDNKFMSLAELSELVKEALPSGEPDLNEQRHERSLSVEGRGGV